MTMSVVENPMTEQTSRNPQQAFALGSAVGAFALLAALVLVFGALPLYWGLGWDSLQNREMRDNVFLADALLILIELGVIGVLLYGAFLLLQQQKQAGVRAGIFIGAAYCFVCLWLTFFIGERLESRNLADSSNVVGWGVMAVIFAALVGAAGYVYVAIPGFLGLMETIEHQGWFHGGGYKGNQGVRVRRGTIVGILAIGVAGIVTMVTHRVFGYERADVPNDWYWVVPYTQPTQYLYLMFKLHLVLPIVLGLGLIWFAWRVVNIPVFADFLIATEAEMNKVSWTNRKRLVQDTIVVLVTVFLFTMFLFVVDIIWIKVLSNQYIQVLLYDPREKQKQQQETAKW
jgi:preprotein translocase SecE subunit